MDMAAVELIDRANTARLGIYTDEQEADELAMEFMARLGLNPKSSIDVFVSRIVFKKIKLR